MIVASPRECEESQDNAVLSQGINDRDQRFQTQTIPVHLKSVREYARTVLEPCERGS
jgi:hypothetical protein